MWSCVQVFLLTTGSGAVGLTLTAANVLYMLEPSHSLSDEAQALNRAHRIGQTRPVRCVIFFVRKTVEERMLAARKRAHAFLDPFDSPEALSVTANSGSQSEKNSTFSIHQLMVLFGLSDSDIGIAPHVHSS
jgi:E3 ubiquitin-protein ligase SHPRH